MLLRRILRRAAPQPSVRAIPSGRRVYAIGDIHGCLDLLDRLLTRIREDDRGRTPAETQLIFLGDLVDRGPDSCGVVKRLMTLKASGAAAVFLKGNHEEILIRTWEGDRRAATLLNRVGGRETLLSYGVTEEEYDAADIDGLTKLVKHNVPEEHIAFLDAFTNWHEEGDYLFVHAGIRPGLCIEEQNGSDLRWIRSAFLTHPGPHSHVVVHGHSISDDVDEQVSRIGIDTGAFFSGTLTAIGLERAERWYLTS